MNSYKANQFLDKINKVKDEYGISISSLAGLLDLSKHSLYTLRAGTWNPSDKWFTTYSYKLSQAQEMLDEYRQYVILTRGNYQYNANTFLSFAFALWEGRNTSLTTHESPAPDRMQSELDELIKAIKV